MNGTLRTACKEMEQDLVLYYYRESGESDRDRVEIHLKGCASCRGFLEDLHKLLPATVKPDEPPASFWENYSREMRSRLEVAASKGVRWKELFSLFRPWPVPALATALVLIAVLTLTLSRARHRQEKLSNETLAEIPAITENLEFFKSLDFIEAMDLLQEMEGTRSDKRTA